jgi:rod shape-determining protein MreC
MRWATGRLYRHRKIYAIASGLAIPLLLFALQLNQKTFLAGIIQKGFYSPFWAFSNKIGTLFEVYQTNISLKSEIVRLKFDKIADEQKRLENERFRRMLNLPPRVDFRQIPADVVSYEQGRAKTSMVIRAGEVLERFLPIVDEDGLVGKISSTTGYVATVSLLTGPNCRVAARDEQTRTLGIIKWRSGNELILDDVAMEHDVFVGDTLVSSGMGGVFPEGLMIGTVTLVDTIPSAFFKEIKVEPAVDFGSLDNVMALKPIGGTFGN